MRGGWKLENYQQSSAAYSDKGILILQPSNRIVVGNFTPFGVVERFSKPQGGNRPTSSIG